MSIVIDEEEYKEKLIRTMKKEVKQIMEEAVTRKFVHEESSSITSLCGAVESCLSHGLKRRTLGLFKTSSTTALIHKVGKSFEPAAKVSKIVQDLECTELGSVVAKVSPRVGDEASFGVSLLTMIDIGRRSSNWMGSSGGIGFAMTRFHRTGLLQYLQYGYWRCRKGGSLIGRPLCPPPSQYRKPVGGSSEEVGGPQRSAPVNARDYVESLHQNNKATLLYGKNNVHVQPKEQMEAMPGYMSLHQTTEGLVIKWTPNHLMNGCCPDTAEDKSIYWEYALNVRVEEIVYVHCHQQGDSGGTIVLVGQDGTQHPPIHFPKGGHLLAFLSCLENGLLPHGRLDPPLWSQRGKGKVFPKLRRKARALTSKQSGTDSEDEEATDYVFRIITALKPDRISHLELMSPLLRGGSGWLPRVPKLSSHSSSTSSSKSLSLGDSMSEVLPPPPTPNPSVDVPAPPPEQVSVKGTSNAATEKNSDSLELLCATMKHQIISRAFYGWLAHCRHLRTVRTHLAGLVLPSASTPPHNPEWEEGVTEDVWKSLHIDGRLTKQEELLARVYLGGVSSQIRKEVWPYLLNHYDFGSSVEEREEQDRRIRQTYETTMSEWLAVEAIVRQRDKEIMAMNMAKLSSESQNGEIPLVGRDRSLSNEVFEPDTLSIGSVDNPGIVQEEDEDLDDFSHIENNQDADKESSDIDPETSQTNHNNMINNEQNEEESGSSKEKTRQESKEDDTAEVTSPTCVVTPDEGVVEGTDDGVEMDSLGDFPAANDSTNGTPACARASFTEETCIPPTTTPVIVSKA
ncbi:small G protein signaling modulator 1-like, partial [Penaeus monodon]|uniref:small G protein signaling modulator 1-like n=1 Tax=Penaeus monodon TaxID=6687 RepID=UPI0018A79804